MTDLSLENAATLEGHYLICAGEPSGDRLAADVMAAMKKAAPQLQAVGVNGEYMAKEGIESLANIKELTVMGFSDVLKQLPRLKKYESRFLEAVDRIKPKFVILVDYPGLHLRLAERLKLKGYRVYQIVAPQLWAWKEKRVHDWKEHIDLMLGVMPFEEEFFAKYDLPFKYVGTPQVDRTAKAAATSQKWPIDKNKATLGFFPGSRKGEFKRMSPAILKIIQELPKATELDLYISLGPDIETDWAVSYLQEQSEELQLKDMNFQFQDQDIEGYEILRDKNIYLVKGHSLELMRHVDAALVTSGTATLECALSDTPMCVAYITGSLNYAIAKRVVKLPYISLVNLVAGEKIVEEFVQNFEAKEVAAEILDLAVNEDRRKTFHAALKTLRAKLKGSMGTNSAREILSHYLNH